VEYFSRQIMLWGEHTQKVLESKKILIVGSGGLGCSVATALSGSGIGQIDIVDFDKVELHNIHRQILFNIEDKGKYKAKVAVEKIKQRALNLKSNAFTCAFEDLKEFNYDLIIDATDNLKVRQNINKIAKDKNIAWIYGSVEEFNGQVCLFKDSSFDMFAIKEVEAKGIAAPMVMQIASFEANLALRYLANLPVGVDIFYYLFFNKEGEFEIKKFKLPKEKK
jgi:adenylyltransferase/sulfurtransferase